jgi:hypothetical protein
MRRQGEMDFKAEDEHRLYTGFQVFSVLMFTIYPARP